MAYGYGTGRRTLWATGVATVAVLGTVVVWQRRKSPRGRATKLSATFRTYRREAEVAICLALKCGEAMRRCAEGRGASAEWKDEDGIDPVTKTDQDNEALVIRGLAESFPSHLVIGEEATAAAGGAIPPLSESTPTFIVDPIDGTQNFVHGAPLSAVSIGLCDRGQPCLGVIYDPHRDELFAGVAGEGAFLNGAPIRCDASAASLQRALVVTDVGYERSAEGIECMMAAFTALLAKRCQSLRIIGSTVLSLAWVACGRANAFYIGAHNEGGKPWDYCAAHVIAVEAGAIFCRLDNRSYGAESTSDQTRDLPPENALRPFDIYSRSCVCAGNSSLASELKVVLEPCIFKMGD